MRNFLVLLVLALLLTSCQGASPASTSGSAPPDDVTETGAVTSGPTIDGCIVFPSDHPLNTPVDDLPAHPRSAWIIARLAPTWQFALIPIKPYNVVSGVPPVPVIYTKWGKTTSPPLVPIPDNPVFMVKTPGLNGFGQPKNLEDNHAVFVDVDRCLLYELWSFDGVKNPDGSYFAGSGWVYDMTSNDPPPAKTATATASGLSVFATLARSEEILAGKISHALGVVTTYTSDGYLEPASSYQPKFGTGPDWDNPDNPVMGQRLRLKADYDITGFGPQARVVLEAAKKYGLIVADGSPTAGNIAGDPNPSLDLSPADLHSLRSVPADAFEVVYTGEPKL